MVPEEELLALKKAVVGNNLDVPYLFAKNDDKQTMPEFEREFQKPVLSPLQVRPVQAWDQALTQGSNVTSRGGEKTFPRRISGIPFNEVTIIT